MVSSSTGTDTALYFDDEQIATSSTSDHHRHGFNLAFDKHDRELQALTTMLSLMKVKKENLVPITKIQHIRKKEADATKDYDLLRILAAVASLLSRDLEVVCIQPKRLGAQGLLTLTAALEKSDSEAFFPPTHPTNDGEEPEKAHQPVPHPYQTGQFAPRASIHITRNPYNKE